jgi:hypothetical protein
MHMNAVFVPILLWVSTNTTTTTPIIAPTAIIATTSINVDNS